MAEVSTSRVKKSVERTPSPSVAELNPEAASVSFEEVADVIRDVVTQQKAKISPGLEGITDQIIDLTKQQAGLAVEAGKAASTVQLQKDTAAIQVDLAAKQASFAAGGADRITALTREVTEADNALATQLDEVDDLVNQDLADVGILTWIGNQFKLGFENNETIAASNRAEGARQALNNAATIPSLARQAAAASEIKNTEATLAANQTLLSNQAATEANIANQKALSTGALQLEAAMKASQQSADNTIRLYQLGVQKDASFRASLEADRKRLREDLYAETVQKGMILEGIPPENIPSTKEIDAGRALSRDPKTLARFDAAFDRATQAGAQTPSDILEKSNAINPNAIVQGKDPALNTLASSVNLAREQFLEKNRREPKKADLPQIKANMDKIALQQFKVADEQIIHGDATNPNQGQPVSVIIKADRLAALPFVSKFLATVDGDAGNLVEMSPTQMLELTIEAIKAGTVTTEDSALGISEIYKQNVIYTNTSQSRGGRGLPFQTMYNAQLTLSPDVVAPPVGTDAFLQPLEFAKDGKDSLVDMSNVTDVRNMIIRLLSISEGKRSLFDI